MKEATTGTAERRWKQERLGFTELPPATPRVSPSSRRLDKATRSRNLDWVRRIRSEILHHPEAA